MQTLFAQILPGTACLQYNDQGTAQGVSMMLAITAVLLIVCAAIGFIVHKKRRRSFITPSIFLAAGVITYLLRYLHRTDECGHGGLYTSGSLAATIVGLVFWVVILLTFWYVILLIRALLSRFKKKQSK